MSAMPVAPVPNSFGEPQKKAGARLPGAELPRAMLFEEAKGRDRFLLGGKGYGLVEMTALGLPVPPGFIVTTQACREFYAAGGKMPLGLMGEIRTKIKRTELKTLRRFADETIPLLFSVRSGAPFSMPGMMDTVLNLGLNDRIADALAASSGKPRFVYDSYRRLIEMFGKIALGARGESFEKLLADRRRRAGAPSPAELGELDLRELAASFKEVLAKETGREFPQDPFVQLEMAVEAVFKSWNNPRAKEYRKFYGIGEESGTAVTIEAMVFGNMGTDSGSGVGFTRDPSTGEKKLYGEYLPNAQGEDVVAGVRTPMGIASLGPRLRAELEVMAEKLEGHFKDVQDFEFTVQEGALYLLQTRNAKRTAQAAVKAAVDMADEGLIPIEESLSRVEPSMLESLLHRRLDPGKSDRPVAKGLNASPGAATGEAVFDAETAARVGAQRPVILVRPETTPDDIKGLIAAQGVLTARGGMTSHAAVVARGMGKPAVVGCGAIEISPELGRFTAPGGTVVSAGDVITIDGTTGGVYLGKVPTVEPEMSREFVDLLARADRFATLDVWANADTPLAAAKARQFGARGIGLCRTERMFNEPDRLPIVWEMILSPDEAGRRKSLERLFPFQKADFKGIFAAMSPSPVVVRLLDLPLHEFLPPVENIAAEIQALREGRAAEDLSASESAALAGKEAMLFRVRQLSEHNPMLGHRGCRLAVTYPEIYAMQVRAILQAAIELRRETGKTAAVKIMLPMVSEAGEIRLLKRTVKDAADELFARMGEIAPYEIGTMIETPRAALTAGEIARESDFFSFGTNDLTQTTFGFSRDDAEAKFVPKYVEEGLLRENPFDSLDVRGVGKLVQMAVREGRAAKPWLEIGICGEHGGDPRSIAFFGSSGLDYVSCSAYRVPVARLAAAQAAISKTSAAVTV